MDREEIIRDVARTLFLCAYADGVEAGEIAGGEPGGGEDWDDVAPRSYRRFSFSPVEAFKPTDLIPPAEEIPDPDAERKAREIVDAFDNRAELGEDWRGGGYPEELVEEASASGGPIVVAARIHAELSKTDRFAHCLAMTALGNGVGLEDDVLSGVRLPGWIRASVPSVEFSWLDLDPERYPSEEPSD